MKSVLKQWHTFDEVTFWQNAIFVFDSSTLLNFYEYSDNARKDIYTNVLNLLTGRLWITNQTEYEFLKNKQKVINRPKILYHEIKSQFYPSKSFDEFYRKYEQLKERTKKDNRHPYFSPEIFNEFDKSLKNLKELLVPLEGNLDNQIEEQLKQHNEAIENDNLLNFFKVTPGYSYNEMLGIIKEGDFRYNNKIPPGYADSKDKELAFEKYGDLFIWKQVIALAKTLKKPVILIIDDLKLDWCITDKNDKRKFIAPRVELIKEIQDEAGIDFWSYDSSTFFHKAKEILQSKVNENVIEEVMKLTQKRRDFIEQAVFNWAKKHFNADETLWAENYWLKDTGVDIIQIVDGVTFSIKIKKYVGRERFRMKELAIDIEEIRSILNTQPEFEINTVIIVGENPKIASAISGLISERLKEFNLIVGFINDEGQFEEIIE